MTDTNNHSIQIKQVLFLSDGTTVTEYTKSDAEKIFVSIDEKEYGPFAATDIYINYSEKRSCTVKNYFFAGKEAEKSGFDGSACSAKKSDAQKLSENETSGKDKGGKVRCFSKEKEFTRIPKALEYADLPYRPEVEVDFAEENYFSADDEDVEDIE